MVRLNLRSVVTLNETGPRWYNLCSTVLAAVFVMCLDLNRTDPFSKAGMFRVGRFAL